MSSKRQIKQREKIKQGKDGKYKCPHYKTCKEKYKGETKNAVYIHVSRDHQKQSLVIQAMKPFMCSCSKRYTRKSDLVYHQQQKKHSDAEIEAFEVDVRDTEEWIKLRNWAKEKYNGQLFDVIMSDPPHPDTGYKLGYGTMTDQEIMSVPIDLVQDRGFVFLWTTNAKKELCETYLKGRGYKMVTTVSWFKTDNGQDLISGLGKVFMHSKEECVVGMKDQECIY
ncbi:MT-A70 family protein [Oxytricha trifallax]|uniref:MT-A70 family protein n=1 Tax=Oxytricha trifallax TaxID=1172189 RepID=A0A073HX87_9SPIT|nr:MT-A70 family protein [Oxytricha trifallax]